MTHPTWNTITELISRFLWIDPYNIFLCSSMFLKLFINFAVVLPNIGWVQVSSRNWHANESQINLKVLWEENIYQWPSRVWTLLVFGNGEMTVFFVSLQLLYWAQLHPALILNYETVSEWLFQNLCKYRMLCLTVFPFLKKILHVSFVSINTEPLRSIILKLYTYIF